AAAPAYLTESGASAPDGPPMSINPRPAPEAVSGTVATYARETSRMLQTLIANIDGMVYRCLNDAQWTMEFVSDGCFTLTGYQPEDLLFNGRISYEELTHPEDRVRIRAEIQECLEKGLRFDIEYRIIHRDGGERWVWERGVSLRGRDGRVMAIEGIIQDITLRKTTWQALRAAE